MVGALMSHPHAHNIAVDASGFSGNLSTSDDTVQKVADVVDSLTAGTGGTGASAHSDLTELDYASAGHTGFQPSISGSGLWVPSGTSLPDRLRVWDLFDADSAVTGTGTFDFTADMTQAALEALGWVFTDCTAAVTDGQLVLTGTATYGRATFPVTLSGNFDFFFLPGNNWKLDTVSGVAVTLNIGLLDNTNNRLHAHRVSVQDGYYRLRPTVDIVTSSYPLSGGTLLATWDGNERSQQLCRIRRTSSTLIMQVAPPFGFAARRNATAWQYAAVTDTRTFTHIYITGPDTAGLTSGKQISVRAIRRYL